MTSTLCEFIIAHPEHFNNPNLHAVKARIIHLKNKQGMESFIDQINNPTEVIDRKATYEAIMKQRCILMDQSFLALSDIIVDEQINNDLLTEHLFPFTSMSITQEGNILVTWD